MHNTRCGSILAALLALIPVESAFAANADDCQGPSNDCVAVGGWNLSLSFGAGVRTNPVLHESDIPLVVIPTFSYYGKRFFIDNLDGVLETLQSELERRPLTPPSPRKRGEGDGDAGGLF